MTVRVVNKIEHILEDTEALKKGLPSLAFQQLINFMKNQPGCVVISQKGDLPYYITLSKDQPDVILGPMTFGVFFCDQIAPYATFVDENEAAEYANGMPDSKVEKISWPGETQKIFVTVILTHNQSVLYMERNGRLNFPARLLQKGESVTEAGSAILDYYGFHIDGLLKVPVHAPYINLHKDGCHHLHLLLTGELTEKPRDGVLVDWTELPENTSPLVEAVFDLFSKI